MTSFLQFRCSKFSGCFRWMLALVWCSGLMAGFLFYFRAEPFLLVLMRGISFDSVSIVGLIISAAFPFFISAFAIAYSKLLLLFAVCFIKAFFYILISLGICFCYGEGGWLVQRLILFHEVFSFPILYTFWCRSLRFHGLPPVSECLGWTCLVILILTLDCHLLDPFWKGLEIL